MVAMFTALTIIKILLLRLTFLSNSCITLFPSSWASISPDRSIKFIPPSLFICDYHSTTICSFSILSGFLVRISWGYFFKPTVVASSQSLPTDVSSLLEPNMNLEHVRYNLSTTLRAFLHASRALQRDRFYILSCHRPHFECRFTNRFTGWSSDTCG